MIIYHTEDLNEGISLVGECGSVRPDVSRFVMVIERLSRQNALWILFCTVLYYAEALSALRHASGTKLDERIVRCDMDLGYTDGSQFGRG